ncbi:hypothetical protein [Streptomyces sp. P17]|uniref:hypothetical protein n=1 Tax=Streptomyces sp. P17 TaxID=3074716 RepID=UPI0028F42A99|nr:hypothetical protein [Streptomyces sp. P17]MDT9700277.1 hypothetical protein [Streptomyces sp. P17]
MALKSFVNKADPMADKGWRGLQEKSSTHTLLVKVDDANALMKAALRDESRHDTRDLLDSHGHTDCCYVG